GYVTIENLNETVSTISGKINDNKIILDQVTTPGGDNLLTSVENGYLDASGNFVSSANWRTQRGITVSEGDVIIYYGVKPYGSGQYAALVGYDSSDSPTILVSKVSGAAPEATESITIPSGIVSITAVFRALDGDEYSLTKSTEYKAQQITDKYDGYLNASGDLVVNSTWETSGYIATTLGDIFEYIGLTAVGSNVARALVGYDENFDFVGVLIGTVTANTPTSHTISNASIAYVRTCSQEGNVWSLTKEIPSTAIKSSAVIGLSDLIESAKDYNNIIKKVNGAWMAVGDSITDRDGTSGQLGYQSFIRQNIKFEGYEKRAYSGWSLGGLTSADTESIVRQRSAWTMVCSLYSCFAGTNDFSKGVALGTIDDYINNTGNLTFYGAYRLAIDRFYELNPKAQIILITPLQRNTSGGSSFEPNANGTYLIEYVDAVLNIAARES